MADQGIATALNFPLDSTKLAPKQNLRLPDAPRGINIKRASVNIPGLVKSTVRSLMVQIAHVETGNDATFNQSDRYGKYAIHKNTLINYGYLSANGNTWLGLEGIDSTSSFLSSVSLQNRLMERFLREQYTACINIGAIQANDGIATVAGMLAVAHQFQDYVYTSNSLASNVAVEIDDIEYFALNNATTVSTVTKHNLLNDDSFVIITNSNVELNGTFIVDKTIDSFTIEYVNETASNANVSFTNDGGSIHNPLPVNDITSSYVVSVAGNLVTYLGNVLTYQGFSNTASRYYTESRIGYLVDTLKNDNKVTINTNLDSRKLFSIIEDINHSSVKTTKLVETALFANIQGQVKQNALTTASTSISSLSNKIETFYKNLPALRAREWRQTGKINDSLNREGALFFNSGRYAVNTLGAG